MIQFCVVAWRNSQAGSVYHRPMIIISLSDQNCTSHSLVMMFSKHVSEPHKFILPIWCIKSLSCTSFESLMHHYSRWSASILPGDAKTPKGDSALNWTILLWLWNRPTSSLTDTVSVPPTTRSDVRSLRYISNALKTEMTAMEYWHPGHSALIPQCIIAKITWP